MFTLFCWGSCVLIRYLPRWFNCFTNSLYRYVELSDEFNVVFTVAYVISAPSSQALSRFRIILWPIQRIHGCLLAYMSCASLRRSHMQDAQNKHFDANRELKTSRPTRICNFHFWHQLTLIGRPNWHTWATFRINEWLPITFFRVCTYVSNKCSLI